MLSLKNAPSVLKVDVVKPSLQLKLGQQLTMTPQLQQAIRLLQLSSLDLQHEIQNFIEQNPLIEREDEQSQPSEQSTQERPQDEHERHGPNWELKLPYPKKFEGVEPQKAAETTLKDHLLWQMDLTPFTQRDQEMAETIIDGINEDGFLETKLTDIQALLQDDQDPVTLDEIEAVLHRIQHFDPLGVGARDLKESLEIQLSHLPKDTPYLEEAKRCVVSHLDVLAKKDYAALKRRLKCDMTQLKAVIGLIQSMNPRPGSEIGARTPDYVTPDAYVYKDLGQWVVELNPECTPNLTINGYYAQLIQQASDSEDTQYMRQHLQEARWFMKSLENRHETLLKVVRTIVDEQSAFLDQGEAAMKPLTLHDVAQLINMHESTVSRVTTQKYIHTPRGTFELKYFFSSNLAAQSGEDYSSTAIRAMIKALIAHEDPKKPLSDSKIATTLEAQGVQVARRTIAKYREALKIPPSNERKQIV